MTIKHLQHVGKRALPWLIITLAALIALPQPAQAAPGDLVFTIEEPGEQTSQVTCPAGLVVEDFDAQSAGAFSTLDLATGNYATGSFDFVINAADDFGGAGGSGNYIRTEIAESYVFTVDTTAFPNGRGLCRLLVERRRRPEHADREHGRRHEPDI